MKTIDNRIARTLVLVVSLILSFPVFGQNADAVDLRLASRVGENFIKLNGHIALSGEPGSLRRVETDKFPNLYIFNADEHGFIIVAGDKRVQPILGFSDEGTFDPNDMSPAAEMIIGGYDYVVDSMVRYNVRATDESVRQAWIDLENGYYREVKGNRDNPQPQYPLAYEPLIRTSWGQGNSDYSTSWQNNYNQFCPWERVYSSKYKVKTGCTSTAMAQILYYFKVNIPSKTISACFLKNQNDPIVYYFNDASNQEITSQKYDGDESFSSYQHYSFNIGNWDYSKSNTRELAAKMMLDCGLTINTRYGKNGSGAFCKSALNSFRVHFGFYNAKGYNINGNFSGFDYLNPDKIVDTLKKYISNKVPLYYEGSTRSGGRHAFIIDGYYSNNSITYFHHNFGFKDGKSEYLDNCYYLINRHMYNYLQQIIILTPIKDSDIIDNKTIHFGQSYHREIAGRTYDVYYGIIPMVGQSQVFGHSEVVYNQPGEYHIKDVLDNRNIFINVTVLPDNVAELNLNRAICKGEPFYKRIVDQAGNVYDFKLSSDSTDFDGSRDFIRYSHNNLTGAIIGKCILTLTTRECNNCTPNVSSLNNGASGSKDGQTTNQIIYESVTKYYEYMYAMKDFMSRVLMEAYWNDNEEVIAFWNLFQSLLDSNTGLISEEGIQQLISQNQLENISDDYIRVIAEGYNQSVSYWNEGYYTNESLPEGYGGMIEYDTAAMRKAYEAQAYAESLGFSDVRQMYDNAYEMLETEIENIQSSVCARVTVQFNQKMTMTREAFNGTLQIFNGHESIPMEDIFVDFRIEDQQGNNCTNLFQINTLSLDQITGITGDGSLAAQTNGTALVQFIPTKNAASTEPTVYSFGGSFSFIDPFTGEGLTYPLHPVDITVNPSPDLYVDIMMQRDILGDDALTLGVVEPSVPAELGVIIHNQGAGIAKNVILETAEPQIIDNEKGLAVSFGLYDASFNGSPRQLGLHDISFGNIESGLTAVGEWRFTSSLLGHFVSYQANLIHNSSYGNPDLSLVSHLDIHELIHPIYAYGNLDDGINDFLVNDNPDAYDTPDSIYFSHGGKTSVGVVDDISFDHLVSPSDTIVTLTVMPSRIGWNYGLTDDPGMNQYNIVSCIRNNDNQVIPLNNVWLTFVTIPDGGDPVYENKLHIVDTLAVQQTTTYTLVFTKKPSSLRIFNGNVDEYWSNAANWEGYILPQADDEVLINGICLLDEDVDVYTLTIAENQNLTIPADRMLNVSGMLTSEATSRMIIEDGGQLMHRNEGVQATVKKNIEPYTNNDNGWYLIASPLVGLTSVASVTNMLSNESDLYGYDEPTAYWINQKYAANGFTELVNGKGYLYANSEGVVLEFPGTLRSGNTTVTVPLFYTEGTDLKGFNLVGNPFVYNLSSYASTNVADGCFRMNETRDDLIVSEVSETNPLKPAEGFFVKAIGEGASITFNPQMSYMAPEGSIHVELTENNLLIDRLIVKTNEAKSLKKFSLNETRTKLFAKDNRHEWALVPCASNEQPVSFKAAQNGTYTINVNADGMEFYYLHLIDNLTGNDVDLLAESSYTFEARTTDYASRFLLRFIPKDSPSTGSGAEHFAYCFNDKWIITNEGVATLQVIDILGHVLSSERINGTCEKQINAASGVYMLRLINGDDVKVQKIVVR